jgi:hypothetical protein
MMKPFWELSWRRWQNGGNASTWMRKMMAGVDGSEGGCGWPLWVHSNVKHYSIQKLT